MLSVRSLTYTYPGETQPSLSDLSFQTGEGECLCITGRSGCGKTTLLKALKGLLPEGVLTGDIEISVSPARLGPSGHDIGFVFQNAETQILCATVAEEVAFGPENLCIAPEEIHRLVAQALGDVGLTGFENRNVERLSAGQKHRLAIASVLSMHPHILLLDEPTSQLDARGKTELVLTLKALKKRGYTLLVVEHQLAPFEGLADRYVCLDEGRITSISSTVPGESIELPGVGQAGAKRAIKSDSDTPMISIRGLRLFWPGVGDVLKDVDISIFKGERVQLFGSNGSGKSSLLAAIAGANPPAAGEIMVGGKKVTKKGGLFGTVAYLLQNPQRQLFENSVVEEVAFSLKRLKLDGKEIDRRVQEALALCEVDHLANRLPLSLSFGEQHRVALASVLAPNPAVLLLDEPFSGLDFRQRRRLLAILARLRDKDNTTIVIASHDALPDQTWADRQIRIENGAVASS